MAQGEGWAGNEEIQGATANWAVAQGARLFLPSAGGAAYRLTMTALPFEYPGVGVQVVTLQINGHELEPVNLSSGWGRYSWDVPADLVRAGLNDLRFQFDRLDAPAEVLPGNGDIGATGRSDRAGVDPLGWVRARRTGEVAGAIPVDGRREL